MDLLLTMESRVNLVATLVDKEMLRFEPNGNNFTYWGDFCHVHWGECKQVGGVRNECAQGWLGQVHYSYVICTECLNKICQVNPCDMFNDDETLREKVDENDAMNEQLLTAFG